MNMPAAEMGVHYDLRVVALSFLIASVAAYVALVLGERVAQSRGKMRAFWLVGGAVSMGTGIWSMHFTGMLAYHLPVAIGYDVPMVVLSQFAAIAASGVALSILSHPTMPRRAWLSGGLLMGGAIVSMHYVGMAAMRLAARPSWDLRIVAASIAIAVGASLAALKFAHALRGARTARTAPLRAAAALVMGGAIAGMHYTGMAAARFVPSAPAKLPANTIGAAALGNGAVAAITIVILLLALAGAYVDRRFEVHRVALAQAQRSFQAVMASAPVVIFVLDADGRITMAEGRELLRVGFDVAAALGTFFNEYFVEIGGWVQQASRALGGEEFSAIADVRGSVIEMRWTPVRAAGAALGVPAGAIAVGTDITERRRAEDALRHQAFHDSLTGLPNRASLHWKLGRAIDDARSRDAKLVLAMLDLNRFKIVNDTLGHEIGDDLLRQVGERVGSVIRATDFFARLGGDEFAIVVSDTSDSALELLGDRILKSLETPFRCRGHALVVGAAIGFARFPEHGSDVTTLMRQADVAMYAAKRSGGGYGVFDASRDEVKSERFTLENDLPHAIAGGELRLYYQPTIDIRSARVFSVEALVRWEHPALGLLGPQQFISIAEETGQMWPLTQWVLDTGLRQIAAWSSRGIHVRIAVNVSMRTFDATLATLVDRKLREHAIDPGRLTIEITETAIMTDPVATHATVERLNALGVQVSIDDFGTGYSSLAYLAQLPVAELKIDRSFVTAMSESRKDAAVARWITGLGRVLDVRVVAEGVETAEVLDVVCGLGCDVAQGYYFSIPLPAHDFERWLAASPWGAPVHPYCDVAGRPALARGASETIV